MIEAMIKGVRNPWKLAELADRRIKASRKQLYDALHGRLTDHHRFVLELYLQQARWRGCAQSPIPGPKGGAGAAAARCRGPHPA
jgi:hypothetical protein